MTDPTRVVAADIRRDHTLLVCQRPAHKRHGGLWEFPGGKCEPGESDTDAIRRELGEELDVEPIYVGEARFEISDLGSPYLIAFIPVSIVAEPRTLEHTALAWASLIELLDMALAPSDRRYVEWLKSADVA
jgi:mutator protein MutT